MTTALILLAVGLVFFLLEFYFPSGLMAVVGGVILLMSVVVLAIDTGSLVGTTLFVILTLVLLICLVGYMLKKIPRTKQSYSIYLDKDQEGYRASSFDSTMIGKTGVVDADLKPGGYILVDGERLQALSDMGYINKGELVEIIGGREESLIVKRKGKLI